jgi:hypothetical protein
VQANKPHARHYVIRVHATDKAGHSSTEVKCMFIPKD